MRATADKKALPKSLHTVRILANVASHIAQTQTSPSLTDLQAVLAAAEICGYPIVSATDSLIVAACAKVTR